MIILEIRPKLLKQKYNCLRSHMIYMITGMYYLWLSILLFCLFLWIVVFLYIGTDFCIYLYSCFFLCVWTVYTVMFSWVFFILLSRWMRTSDMKLNNETIGMMKICICSVPYQINYICGVMASASVLKHISSRSKSKDWMASGISSHRLLFPWYDTIKIQLTVLIYHKVGIIIKSKCSLLSPWYSWKKYSLGLNNNHSLILYQIWSKDNNTERFMCQILECWKHVVLILIFIFWLGLKLQLHVLCIHIYFQTIIKWN